MTEIDIQKQLRMLELRREVERLIARRAARLASPDERQDLRQIAEDMAAAGRASNTLLDYVEPFTRAVLEES